MLNTPVVHYFFLNYRKAITSSILYNFWIQVNTHLDKRISVNFWVKSSCSDTYIKFTMERWTVFPDIGLYPHRFFPISRFLVKSLMSKVWLKSRVNRIMTWNLHHRQKKPSKRNVISVVQSDYNVVTVVYDVVDYFPVFISLLIDGLWQDTIYFTAFHIQRFVFFRKLVRTMLETWNLVRKYKHKFRKYTF